MTKSETFTMYKVISGKELPIIVGINDLNLLETVQLNIAEAYIEGYKKRTSEINFTGNIATTY